MYKNEIAEINLYCDPNSILIVTNNRKLERLRCPFEVEFLYEADNYKKGDSAYVEAVKINDSLQLIYIINSRGYLYSLCKIVL